GLLDCLGVDDRLFVHRVPAEAGKAAGYRSYQCKIKLNGAGRLFDCLCSNGELRLLSLGNGGQIMRLSELLKPQNIKLGLAARNKSEAIAELVTLLAANHEVTDAKKVLDSVLEREGTRTTGIGNGLAIPHGKTNGT